MALPNYLHTSFPCSVGFSLKLGHCCSDNTLIRAMKDMGMKNAEILTCSNGQMAYGDVPDVYVVDRIMRCRLVDKCVLMAPRTGFKLAHCHGMQLYIDPPRIYK